MTVYVCPTCHYRQPVNIRLDYPPTCCNKGRHPVVAMTPAETESSPPAPGRQVPSHAAGHRLTGDCCECGAYPPLRLSVHKMRAWHRDHKAAQLELIS